MLPAWFIDIGCVIALFVLAAWGMKLVRMALIENGATVQKETDLGEHLTFSANFLVTDSAAKRKKRLDEIISMGENRRKEIVRATQEIVAQAEGKKPAEVRKIQ